MIKLDAVNKNLGNSLIGVFVVMLLAVVIVLLGYRKLNLAVKIATNIEDNTKTFINAESVLAQCVQADFLQQPDNIARFIQPQQALNAAQQYYAKAGNLPSDTQPNKTNFIAVTAYANQVIGKCIVEILHSSRNTSTYRVTAIGFPVDRQGQLVLITAVADHRAVWLQRSVRLNLSNSSAPPPTTTDGVVTNQTTAVLLPNWMKIIN